MERKGISLLEENVRAERVLFVESKDSARLACLIERVGLIFWKIGENKYC
jgi:hypothetical protein